ncbi:MAG: UDP-glucose/GDP-mannose dehydrogenase family protein [Verrucomicrobiota bacterium]
MKLSIIGSGYVGLVTGTCFAEVGHTVICVDNNIEKVKQLRSGQIPIYEPGLEELVRKNVQLDRLTFTDSIKEGVDESEVVFIAVPTPPQDDGSVDLSYIETVARSIAEVMDDYRVVVDKSTVPVKTGDRVAETIRRYGKEGLEFDVVSNPEFLREGSAVDDLMKPDRIVVGANTKRAFALMEEIYTPFKAPIMRTDLNSAELIKHASNSFLALKISYINAVSAICEASGADVNLVAEGMGADHRIGRAFLNAGLGYGGSCFPKDLTAFIHIAEELGYDFQLLKEVEKINENQLDRFLKKIREVLWMLKDKKIGQLGLAFKGNTDDIRSSVGIKLALKMLDEGAVIKTYDPKAMGKCGKEHPTIPLVEGPYDVVEDAEALIIATEWADFKALDWLKIKDMMRTPLVFDGRNLLNPEEMKSLGFEYYSIGRQAVSQK